MENQVKTMADLTVGTVINFNRSVTADDTNFVVLRQYSDKWGDYTECLNLENYNKESFSNHTEITNFWSIIKE